MLKGKKILVTGGCGYIGSHTIVDLASKGAHLLCVDNLSNSDKRVLSAIEKITGVTVDFLEIELQDANSTFSIFENHKDIAGIIHFAALKSVGDSVKDPIGYYKNNLISLMNLLEAMQIFGNRPFVFSSSCSVYGNAIQLPVTENTPLSKAESPYARTKIMGEEMISDFAIAHPDSRFVLLRYFNPAGAHPSSLMGENPINPANNLLPIITEVAAGLRPVLSVFGNDYDTPDGTCIRDYIHIMDLASAHSAALEYLFRDASSLHCDVFNVGLGKGVSVLEAISAFERVTGNELNYEIVARRQGDVEAVFADTSKVNKVLNWKPIFSLDDIMLSAWNWQLNKSNVYRVD
jgi:UDP-glucose 4-epimerase